LAAVVQIFEKSYKKLCQALVMAMYSTSAISSVCSGKNLSIAVLRCKGIYLSKKWVENPVLVARLYREHGIM
jgi:hypothetical protein